MGFGVWEVLEDCSLGQTWTKQQGPMCLHSGDDYPLSQDYELFVEAVEQNTLQEFLKLA